MKPQVAKVPRAILLDITRLASRLGRGAPTGIDRVEAAYLTYFLAQDGPLWGLLRTSLGYMLLDRQGCAALAAFAATPSDLPPIPLWLRPFAKPTARGAIALRKFAVSLRPHSQLLSALRPVPPDAIYLNIGHSNLTAPCLLAIKAAGLRSAVMVHDTIPLDYPQFTRHGTVAAFAAKIAAVAQCVDHVIHVSQDARNKTEMHLAAAGRVPPGVTAHLGMVLAAPTPPPFTPQRPYFVALGTIEPRKNLALLLDIWQTMGAGAPQLVVIGAKGWADAALFDQMAALQARGTVIHGENLPDGAVASLLQGAMALLFPSMAEGFGLPPLEAACRGVPVIAADLPVLRETCGEFPVYLDPTDSYSWMETIQSFARAGHGQTKKQAVPQWADHFKTVLTQID